MPSNTKDIQATVDKTVLLQKEIEDKIAELKHAQDEINATWKQVESAMIGNDIKSIKGDWGSITIAEKNNFKADLDILPSKFIKKVADTTKIGTFFKLEGTLPKGVELSKTKYLTKRIK